MANILLTGLPMPPSSNNCYITSRQTGGRFPSKELKTFQRDMRQWRLEHLAMANRAKAELVARFKSEQRFIRVDRYFFFPRHQLVNLDGTPKRMDASNRIKALDDSLGEDVLGIDDAWFAAGSCEKALADEGSPASVTVCMTLWELGDETRILRKGLSGGSVIPWAVHAQRKSTP